MPKKTTLAWSTKGTLCTMFAKGSTSGMPPRSSGESAWVKASLNIKANAQRTAEIILNSEEKTHPDTWPLLRMRWHISMYVEKTKIHSKCVFRVKNPVAMSGSAENFCPVWFQRLITRNAIARTVEAIAGLKALDSADLVLMKY